MMQLFAYSVNFEREAFIIPLINLPIYWYGILFAIGFYLSNIFCSKLLVSECIDNGINLNKKIDEIMHSLSLYLMIAIVVGARVVHVAFYDGFNYLLDLAHVLNLRDGGLASHGAVIFIIAAYIIWTKRYKTKIQMLGLDSFKIFDCIVHASLINAIFIRIGNFINQEIIGKPTDSFLGIIFQGTWTNLPLVPRHPAQLYEALFYLIFFIILVFLKNKTRMFSIPGMLTSFFFIVLFSGRFFLEQFKENQSIYDQSGVLMGQLLSIPFILIGIGMALYLNRNFVLSKFFKKLDKKA